MALSIVVYGIIFVIVVAMMGTLGYFGNRARKGFRLIITKDGRNSDIGEREYFMLPEKANLIIKIYKSKWSLKVEKKIPFFDPNSFKTRGKIIYAMQGVTGNKDDDNIIPFASHIMSSATATSNTQKLVDKISDKLRELGVTAPAGQELDTLLTEGKEIEIEKEGKKHKVKVEGFTSKWLLGVFGVPDTSDGNALMLNQRSMIEASHRITNEFRQKHLSPWAKHGNLIVLGIVIFMLFIAFAPIITATLQYQQNLASATQGFLDHINGLMHPNVTLATVPNAIR